jgi:S-formylglutathione hydrolase FrmB
MALAKAGGIRPFVEKLQGEPKIGHDDMHALMLLAMAATYDPDPDAFMGIRLPVDLETCALDQAAWSRWLAHDPLEIAEDAEAQANLRTLRGLFIDCGSRDQYFLHFGSRRLSRRLHDLGIAHTYEEFDDDHSSIDYRMDVSLPFLYRALTS